MDEQGTERNGVSRREAMKTAMKAGAYAAPVILGASAIPQAVGASPPICGTPRVVGSPSTIASGLATDLPLLRYIGSGFTPNTNVQIAQLSGVFIPGRGIIIVPGTTRPVDANGNFDIILPPTIFNFTGLARDILTSSQQGVPPGSFAIVFSDAAGCGTVNVIFTLQGPPSFVFQDAGIFDFVTLTAGGTSVTFLLQAASTLEPNRPSSQRLIGSVPAFITPGLTGTIDPAVAVKVGLPSNNVTVTSVQRVGGGIPGTQTPIAVLFPQGIYSRVHPPTVDPPTTLAQVFANVDAPAFQATS